MIDLIVYCPDTKALMAVVESSFPERASEGNFLVDKTPTRRKDKETLAVVRCRDGDPGEPMTEAMLKTLETEKVITILGTWEEVKAMGKTAAKRKKYDKVHPRTLVQWTDENGVEYEHKPSEQIGAFA